MAKGKKAIKKAVKKMAKAPAKKSKLAAIGGAVKKAAPFVAAGAAAIGLGVAGSKIAKRIRARGVGKKRSAKALLRRAYERRARNQIRQGNLGQARRTLRKKATVV